MERNSRRILVLVSFLFVFTNSVAQQEKISLQLLDKFNDSAIIGAHFIFNDQMGYSDDKGIITFELRNNGTLNITHVRYGNWYLDYKKILEAIETGKIYKDEEVYKLQPVSVIAMHRKVEGKEKIGLEVEDQLSHDGGAILNNTVSINSIRKSGSYGFDPVLRGFKYDQLNIVIDGSQSAVAACPNRMDPPTSQISPNMIESIEIYKGPHSLRYGASFGGTINFISSPSRFSQNPQLFGRITSSSESNGGILRSEGLFGLRNENINLELLGSISKGNDYKDGDGIKVSSSFQRISFGINAGVNFDKKNKLKLSVTRNIAEDSEFPALPMDLRSDKTFLINLSHTIDNQGKYLKVWKTNFYLTAVDHNMDNFDKSLNPRMLNAKTEAETHSYGGRSEGSWLLGKGNLFAGLDLRIEEADGTRIREFLLGPNAGKIVYDNVWNGGQVSKTGLFAEYHHSFSSIKFVLSGRVEYNKSVANNLDTKFKNKNTEFSNSQINPSLSVGGLKKINNDLTVGLWLGRAQRSGSLTEKYINSFPVGIDPYDMLGNPTLEPEINNQIDLTLTYNSESTYVDIGMFASILNDYISSKIDTSLSPTMPSSPGVRRFENITDAFMTGFEIIWKQYLFFGIRHKLSAAYTYGTDRENDSPLPEIAPLDLRYHLISNNFENKLKPEIKFRYVLEQNRISDIFGENKTPSFTLIDLKLSYFYSPNISFTIGVENLLDEAYYEHLSRSVRGTNKAIFAPGRNIYLALNLDFM